jgi:gamma-glutamyltranspeptidase / glutathione hydrolase
MRRCAAWLTLCASLTTLTLGGCASRSIAAADGERAAYRSAAVAADHPLASQAGLEMLQRGGNAVDAAVATSFCLSVVRPFSCGIGGGGFMLIWIPPARSGEPGRAIAINYRETCPAAVGPDFYARLDDKDASKYGWKASGVPGTVAGLCHALKEHGTLDLKTVLTPAIRAAEHGFEADQAFVNAAREVARVMEKRSDLQEAAGAIWKDLCREGKVQVGDVIRNRDQARALRSIAWHGPTTFYDGEIARVIDASMREHAGTLTLADLGVYRTVEAEPLIGSFHGCEIISMPPPSSGGIAMQQTFGVLDRRWTDLEAASHNSSNYVHLTVEAMKHAFADRSRWLADPAFVEVPAAQLVAPAYLDARAALIDMTRTREPQSYGTLPLPEDGGTSHFCVLDANGMAVACTETINLEFGSLVCVPGFGFALNNQMDDFTTIPGQPNAFGLRQNDANLPEPGKRPLSSMSPTIVVKNGKVVMIAGASGGPRIISATLQCTLNVMLFGMTPDEAVRAPRFHHQWMPNVLQVDPSWPDQSVLDDLKRRGHEIGTMTGEAVVQMIAVDERDGTIRAACDPRKGGKPAGY